jgi:hypothetical protein
VKRVECPRHIWLLTSENPDGDPPTIRVKCWLCWKRHRWPAAARSQVRDTWSAWSKRALEQRNR